MTTGEIRAAVLGVLGRIAPEITGTEIPESLPLREAADLDSVDFLNFVVGLHDTLGVDVPESDYEQVATLGGCVAYVSSRIGAPAS
jgi:acyl carrier protein